VSRTATHCNTPQHTRTHCNTLQHTATQNCQTQWPPPSRVSHTATHCNTLQQTVTHCNTLEHTATRCKTKQRRIVKHSCLCQVEGFLPTHFIRMRGVTPSQVCCSVLQCVAAHFMYVCCDSFICVLRCVAVCSSVLQCAACMCGVTLHMRVAVSCSVLQCVAVCCSELQCVAVCCNT